MSSSKWLIPEFLRSLDQYLRERYPLLWYSGSHWVLYYGLMGGIVLFGAGLLYPVHWVTRELEYEKNINLDHWVVDPIKPIEFAYDELYIYSLLPALAFVCIWMYRQSQIRQFFYRIQDSLFCLLIYAGCWWVLCGITVAAFRMGTIFKTACIWMPERDLKDFKTSGIYPYGFVLLQKGSKDFIPNDTLFFFRKGEKIFRHILENEEALLKSRYRVDTSYWKKRLKVLDSPYHQPGRSDRSDRSYRSDRSELSDLPELLNQLYRLEQEDRSYISDRSCLSDLSSLQNLSYLSDFSDRSYFSDDSYLLYRFNRSDRSEKSGLRGVSDLFCLSQLSTYYNLTRKKIKHPRASAYMLINYNDTLCKAPLVIIPGLPNQIEDAVRSVEHAQQFLKEGIFWGHFGHLLYYLFLMATLLFLLPRVSAKHLLPLILGVLMIWFGFKIFSVETWEGYKAIWKSMHVAAYLLLPLSGLLLLLWMLWQQKQGQLFTTAVNMIFLGVLIVLLGALNVNRGYTLEQFGSPIDAAFFGTQVIGLIAAFVAPYVQAMPKTK